MVNQESDRIPVLGSPPWRRTKELCTLAWQVCRFDRRDGGSCRPGVEKSLFKSGTPVQASIESGLGGRAGRRPGTFLEGMNRIDRQAVKAFHQPAGPAHLHPIDLGGGAEAEVNADITIRDVAGPAANFVNQSARADFHR